MESKICIEISDDDEEMLDNIQDSLHLNRVR